MVKGTRIGRFVRLKVAEISRDNTGMALLKRHQKTFLRYLIIRLEQILTGIKGKHNPYTGGYDTSHSKDEETLEKV